MKSGTLWTKDFTTITLGTVISAIGGVAINFALSFVVFDETGSTLKTGLFLALSLLPQLVLPLLVSPWLDRFPKKPVIVSLDYLDGALYLLLGLYLGPWQGSFSYPGYLLFSLFMSAAGSIYSLAYTSLYPQLIPKGFAQQGYTISNMIYPTVNVVMAPAAGFLYEHFGLPPICLLEGLLLILAAAVESRIRGEDRARAAGSLDLHAYMADLKAALGYLKGERGLLRIYLYMPVTNGVSRGCASVLVAFFSTMPGFTASMYAFLSVAEFLGRSLGGLVHYRLPIPPKRRFGTALLVYQLYNLMDMCLLYLGYPLMLVNRALCGFLGINTASMREAAVQQYIPDAMRAKVNALFNMAFTLIAGLLGLGVGALGELLPYRLCLLLCGAFSFLCCHLLIARGQGDIAPVYGGREAETAGE